MPANCDFLHFVRSTPRLVLVGLGLCCATTSSLWRGAASYSHAQNRREGCPQPLLWKAESSEGAQPKPLSWRVHVFAIGNSECNAKKRTKGIEAECFSCERVGLVWMGQLNPSSIVKATLGKGAC